MLAPSNSTGNNGRGKAQSAATISSRVADPTLNQIPWFAPVDESHMVIFTNGEAVLDSYAIEVSIDQRFNQTNNAFVLFSQGARFFDTPEQIIEKIVTVPLLIADLTDSNANVFYELSLRHVLDQPAILMIQENQLDAIPFHFYPTSVLNSLYEDL